jgi:hypothetical protein
VTEGSAFDHPPEAPSRIGPVPTGDLNTAAAELRVIAAPQEVWTAVGWWSNCDIYVDVPESWNTAAISLTLYAVTNGVRAIVATTTIPAAGLEPVFSTPITIIARRGIALSGRGHPASAWIVTATNSSGIPVLSGTIVGEVWGDQSTPDGIGRTPANQIFDKAMPSRAAHLMGLAPLVPGSPRVWVPATVSPTTGAVLVDAAIVVPPLVVGAVSRFQNLGALADAAVKATPGSVFSASVENVSGPAKFFQLHNKIGALVPADVPFITIAIPANSTVIIGNDFFGPPFAASPLVGGLFFSTGIRWGWSTSRALYTAAGAATQATQILFV